MTWNAGRHLGALPLLAGGWLESEVYDKGLTAAQVALYFQAAKR